VRCPDGAALAAWVDGEVVDHAADGLGAHVADCPRCRRAERAQRQVKRRTSLLRTEVGTPRPDADLLSMLMTLPQVEHDRALRRAHRASCGEAHPGTAGSRLRIAVVGAGAVVWLAAAVWSAPAGSAPAGVPDPTSAGGATPTAANPVHTASADRVPAVPGTRWTGIRQASTDRADAR
jgi:hypothetical protein